ncbi:MAG TPA: organic solvent ABC transporter ATP-binding protein [Geobacter sp.]|nr:organic solvent ABC transporter ATP-binding protein [Geobacter sp.]
MEFAVKFDNVVADELQEKVSFAVTGRCMTAAVTARQEENELLVRLMLGLARPLSGEIALLGEDVCAASEKALNALRRKVAVVYPTGGLISNLKVWENLVLPLEYFSVCPQGEIEERGMSALQRVGYAGGLMELPGHLSLYARRQVGLARAMLLDPELVIYDEILAGLSGDQRDAITGVMETFHRESPGRSSLFLTANKDAVREIAVEARIAIKGSSLHD